VPETVALSETVNVFEIVPPDIENPVALAVGINPLIEVAVATPRFGVTRTGESNGAFKFRFVVKVASAVVLEAVSADKVVFRVPSATVALVTSLFRLVVKVASAVVLEAVSADKVVFRVPSADVALVISLFRFVVKVASAVVLEAVSAAKSVDPIVFESM